MRARPWTCLGLVFLAAVALWLAAKPRSAPAPSSLAPAATPSHVPDPRRGLALGRTDIDARPEPGVRPQTAAPAEVDGRQLDETHLGRRSPGELLKRYEELWRNPDASELRAAEEDLLRELAQLPPDELVALLRLGLGTRPVNLVMITLENAMGGPRPSDYADALVVGMEDLFEQPDKLEVLAGVALRFDPSGRNAEVAARLLMKRGPAGRLAEHLGGFAARLEGDPRREVKEFAVEHHLIETLGHLVDDGSDIARLQGYLGNPATRHRARRALETANTSATKGELRRQIQRAVGQ
jgi:hypothetical protein